MRPKVSIFYPFLSFSFLQGVVLPLQDGALFYFIFVLHSVLHIEDKGLFFVDNTLSFYSVRDRIKTPLLPVVMRSQMAFITGVRLFNVKDLADLRRIDSLFFHITDDVFCHYLFIFCHFIDLLPFLLSDETKKISRDYKKSLDNIGLPDYSICSFGFTENHKILKGG